jgi:hypothetical protein
MPKPGEATTLSERIARSETNIEALTLDVRNVAASVQQLANTQAAGMERIYSKIDAVSRPNFSVMGTWAGVVLLFVGMAGAPYVREIWRVEHDGRVALMAGLAEATTGRDRIERDQRDRSADNRKLIDGLDVALQREMRLINETTRVAVNELDGRLQREMTQNATALTRETHVLAERFQELRIETLAREDRLREVEKTLAGLKPKP